MDFLNHRPLEILISPIQSPISILTICNILNLQEDLLEKHWLKMNLLTLTLLALFIKWFLCNKLSFLTLNSKIIHSINPCCGLNKIPLKKAITHSHIFTTISVKESSKISFLEAEILTSMKEINNVNFVLIFRIHRKILPC